MSAGYGLTTGSYNGGYLILQRFTQLGTVPTTLTLNSTATYLQYGPSSVLGGNVTSVSPGLFFNGCTFNGTSTCTKNGSSGDFSQGGNVFNGLSNITNSGSSYLLLGNTNPDTWNSDVTFTNNGSERLLPCWATVGNLFNGNIYVNTSGSALGIQFCGGNATATATLAATKTIAAGSTGLNAGYLQLKQFTQLGSAPINLTLSSTATYLQYGPSSLLGGNVTSVSPGLFFNGCTFNGLATCTKNGTTNDNSNGNNIFNGTTIMNNTGSGYLLFGNGNRDQFNTTATFNNLGSSQIYVAYNSVNNIFGGVTTFNNSPTSTTSWIYVATISANNSMFNDNIIVNCTNGAGILFGNSTGTSTLSAGKTISVGAGGFNAGQLILKQFTQVSATAQSLTTTGTSLIQYGPTSSFDGNVTSVSPGLFFNGCTFNGLTNCTKNGSSGDYSVGGNVFNGVSNITNSGSSFLLLGNSNPDIWNNDVTFTNNGSERLLPCWATVGNMFNGNIYVNTSGSAQGIQFCGGNSTATATLAATKTIAAGTTGLNAGYLQLKQFTQLGSAPINLTLSSTATYLQYGPSSLLGGNVTSISPGLFFNGCTFNGLATCTKNGTTNDNSNGNNIFNGTTIMNNTGSGYLLFGNGNRDQFNTTATFNNLGSSHIYVAYNSINNIFGGVTTFNNAPTSTGSWIYISNTSANNSTFNDNIIVNCNNGAGIYFGNSTGTSTLSAGKTINIGAGGFNAGQLVLKQFTQVSATPQSLTTTGTSFIQYGPSSSFDGNVTSVSPGLFFNTSVFNGAVNSTKNGTTNDVSPGGNTFNGSTSLTNVNTGAFYMANSTSDAYNGNVIFTQNNTGIFYPNHNTNCTYAGNITVNSTGTYTITFGQAGGGIATLTGGTSQTINKTGTTGNPVFTRLIINKSVSDATLNTRANVSTYLTLTQGILNTTQTNILNMNNASTTTIGNALSFINGPMNYDMALNGPRTLNFPVGKIGPVLSGTATVITTDWRPAILNSVHNNGTSYTYNTELFISSADALGWAMPATVANVSRIHWWDIARTNTSTGVITPTLNLNGNQTITLYYDVNDGVTDPTNLTICKNTYTATTAWKDIGGSGATMTTGNVTSSSAPTAFNSFSRFTLGNRIGGVNPLPIELLSFIATPINKQVNLAWVTASETNNDHFEIERSIDGINFEYVTKVKAYGNGNSSIKQTYNVLDENPYKGLSYYRLKQVDKTSDFKYANIVSIDLKENSYLNIYPNPATDKLYINASNNYNNSIIKVISATGIEVKSAQQLINYNGIIDLSDLASGMYFIVVNNGTSIQNIKISIQK